MISVAAGDIRLSRTAPMHCSLHGDLRMSPDIDIGRKLVPMNSSSISMTSFSKPKINAFYGESCRIVVYS